MRASIVEGAEASEISTFSFPFNGSFILESFS